MVPNKTLLKAAGLAQSMRQAGRFGIVPFDPAVNLKDVLAHVRAVIEQVYQAESPGRAADQGR